MSIRSLTTLAVQRDQTAPNTNVGGGRNKEAVKPGQSVAGVPQDVIDTLTSSIPTESLALYTAFVGLFTANLGGDFLPLRWAAYIAFLLVTVFFVCMIYFMKVKEAAQASSQVTGKRQLPIAEALSALVAAGAWGLVMPGSPLGVMLDGATETVTLGAVAIGASAVITMMSFVLRMGTGKATAA